MNELKSTEREVTEFLNALDEFGQRCYNKGVRHAIVGMTLGAAASVLVAIYLERRKLKKKQNN